LAAQVEELPMLDEAGRQAVVERYFSYGPDEMDLAHQMYHDDAVLEFPQSGERFEGVENFKEWRAQYPAEVDYRMRRITTAGDQVNRPRSRSGMTVGPGCLASACSSSAATRWPGSGSTSWKAGRRPSGDRSGGRDSGRSTDRLIQKNLLIRASGG
jgi:hypothetical protein